MAALTAKSPADFETLSFVKLPAKLEATFQGGSACFDTATGLVAKGFVATTLIPLGIYTDDKTLAQVTADPFVTIQLHREMRCRWFGNNADITAANLGALCYLQDDNLVSSVSTGKSIAGRIVKVDTLLGVLVSPLFV
jgi:hypothetical protein